MEPERQRRKRIVRVKTGTGEVICAGWGEPGGHWTEWGWRNKEGSWFHRYVKEWLVICNEEDTDGRARVTTDEELVLGLYVHVDWTEIRDCIGSSDCDNFIVEWGVYIQCVHLSWLLSQCRDLRMGVIWENLAALTTVRARQLWVCWRRFIWDLR